ncbi:hypothetical protein CVIRNUC_006247 [Coccomyxa viridis]|uniref:Uncharacterized protein n=1 Tax=Coccomyxa viridis TaxID=1274662 RepID=A0AAV1I8L1_9CHLO|nr:hypothetical protein CVIRNUC_006247 [Coccomyxa viridis]
MTAAPAFPRRNPGIPGPAMSAPMAPFVRAGVTLIARIPAIACACAFSPLKASRYAFSPRTTRKPSSPALRSSLGGLPSLWQSPGAARRAHTPACAAGAAAPSMPAPDRQSVEPGPAADLKFGASSAWLPPARNLYGLWLPALMLWALTVFMDGKGLLYLLSACTCIVGIQLIIIYWSATLACGRWSRAARNPLYTAFCVGLVCGVVIMVNWADVTPQLATMVDVALGPNLSTRVWVPQAVHACINSPSAAPFITCGYAAVWLMCRVLLAAATLDHLQRAWPILATSPIEMDMTMEPRGQSPAYTGIGSALQAPAVHPEQPGYTEAGQSSFYQVLELCCHTVMLDSPEGSAMLVFAFAAASARRDRGKQIQAERERD